VGAAKTTGPKTQCQKPSRVLVVTERSKETRYCSLANELRKLQELCDEMREVDVKDIMAEIEHLMPDNLEFVIIADVDPGSLDDFFEVVDIKRTTVIIAGCSHCMDKWEETGIEINYIRPYGPRRLMDFIVNHRDS